MRNSSNTFDKSFYGVLSVRLGSAGPRKLMVMRRACATLRCGTCTWARRVRTCAPGTDSVPPSSVCVTRGTGDRAVSTRALRTRYGAPPRTHTYTCAHTLTYTCVHTYILSVTRDTGDRAVSAHTQNPVCIATHTLHTRHAYKHTCTHIYSVCVKGDRARIQNPVWSPLAHMHTLHTHSHTHTHAST
jgi:hypothetical protein